MILSRRPLYMYSGVIFPMTSIQFELPEDAFVELNIFGLERRLIKTLNNSQVKAGHHIQS